MEYQKSMFDKKYLLNLMEERDKSSPYKLLHSPDKTDTFLASITTPIYPLLFVWADIVKKNILRQKYYESIIHT